MERDFSPDPIPAKEELRRSMRARLRGLSPDLRAEASLVMCQKAAHLSVFVASRCVALFAPLLSEPDIHPLIEEAWAQGKRVVLPLMIKHDARPQLDWHEVASWDEIVESAPFGLREPDPLRCPRVAIAKVDCAFIPGLAFDDAGFRLGRGGGFYDTFLGRTPATLPRIGLMFSCQHVPVVPRDSHDQALHHVITEDGMVSFA